MPLFNRFFLHFLYKFAPTPKPRHNIRMWQIGIDPGLTGAIAGIDRASKRLRIVRMVTRSDVHGREYVDAHEMLMTLQAAGLDESVGSVRIELVHAIFGSSAKATFAFGRAFGAIECVADILWPKIGMQYIQPKAWKHECGLLGNPKATGKTLAQERYAGYDIKCWTERGKIIKTIAKIDDAEACLIAG